MHFDFPTILVLLTAITGLIWLADVLFLARRRREAAGGAKVSEPMLVEYSRSFFPVILVVLILRSFLVEPFRIPSGSMMPTLLVGDFILVNKYAYGLRLPSLNTKVLDLGEPQRGDVVVFRFPGNPAQDYIKRVVGVPGDTVDYRNKTLLINGVPQLQTVVGRYAGEGSGAGMTGALELVETLGKVEHHTLVNPRAPDLPFGCEVLRGGPITIPEGNYFAMGDNRDNSNDSRCWGLVPEANLAGRAFAIWMNWDGALAQMPPIAWERLGTGIH